ncbi:MAG: D-alanyl-D-alanine carboxypeptidase [Actinomycetaceae bacterium]|nr:D-alanyl-D-alanine carboxypeptidase [Actinomycetaceae bacterium]
MNRSLVAPALVTTLILGAAGGYALADAYDLVPGVLTLKPALPTPQGPTQYTQQLTPRIETPPSFSHQSNPIDKAVFNTALGNYLNDPRRDKTQLSLYVAQVDGQALGQARDPQWLGEHTKSPNPPVFDPGILHEVITHNPDTFMAPASSMKILTAHAALGVLGPERRFYTSVVWDPVSATMTLVGGGDVLLGTGASNPAVVNGYAGLETLADLCVERLKELGAYTGSEGSPMPVNVRVDDSLYGEEVRSPDWTTDEVNFVAPIRPLAVGTGRVDPEKWEFVPEPGLHAGLGLANALNARGFAVQGEVTRGEAPPDFSPLKLLQRGRIAEGGALDTVEAKDAETVKSAKPGEAAKPPESPVEIGAVESAPVAQIVRLMLKESDNTLAETLGRAAAIEAGKGDGFEGANAVVHQGATQRNDAHSHLKIRDCSGLSKDSRVSARVLVDSLANSMFSSNPMVRSLAVNLPVAGVDGTLKGRYTSTATSGELRAKTGSLSATISLTGNFQVQGKVILFSAIVTLEPGSKYYPTRAALDDLLRAFNGETVDWQKPEPQEVPPSEMTPGNVP